MAKQSERIPVQPAVLLWARESISLSVDEAARRIGVSPEILDRWESGELAPTIAQLRTAADKYKRPLAVLLLSSPPTDFDAMRDFRRQALSTVPWSPELHGEFRRALAQREVFLELAEDVPDSLPESVRPPQIRTTDDPEVAGELLREYLEVGLATQLGWRDQFQALNGWIASIEARGMIVIHTRAIAVSEMRAFSIGEWPYPVIALNGSDFPRARTFSLLHELAHLALNIGGLCDLHEQQSRQRPAEGDRLEHFCNQVAAAALLPRKALLEEPAVSRATVSYNWTLDDLRDLARRYHTSSEAFLLRLISLDKAEWATYWRRKDELQAEYDSAIERRRERQREGKGGANYYRTKARDIGHSYASAVLDAYSSRSISARDVADYLDIKYNQLDKLQAEVR